MTSQGPDLCTCTWMLGLGNPFANSLHIIAMKGVPLVGIHTYAGEVLCLPYARMFTRNSVLLGFRSQGIHYHVVLPRSFR